MAAVLVKSLAYLGAFGSLGYVLMFIAEPSEEKKRIIAGTGYRDPSSNEVKSQKALFLEKIKEATTDTPIYLKKASSKPLSQEAPQQPTKREIN